MGLHQYILPEKLAPFQTTHILLGWDFNSILNATLDTSNPQRNVCPDLAHWGDTFALMEFWQWKHATTKTFSHLSAIHKSRIDLAFGSLSVQANLSKASYCPAGLSDHSPLELCLCYGRQKDPGT